MEGVQMEPEVLGELTTTITMVRETTYHQILGWSSKYLGFPKIPNSPCSARTIFGPVQSTLGSWNMLHQTQRITLGKSLKGFMLHQVTWDSPSSARVTWKMIPEPTVSSFKVLKIPLNPLDRVAFCCSLPFHITNRLFYPGRWNPT